MRIRSSVSAFTGWLETKRGQMFVKIIKWSFNGYIIVYLIKEIWYIGWKEIVASLPTQPLFYLIFLVMYFALPISEYFIYKVVWSNSVRNALPTFIIKKIYNNSLIGYSGDIYLALWASKSLKISKKKALHVVKDNAILSTVGSSLFAILILVIFLVSGNKPTAFINVDNLGYGIYAVIIILILAILMPRSIRKKVFQLGFKTSITIIGIHFLRLLFLGIIQIIQWEIVLAEIELSTWITFAALQIITTRIPLLPNRDLIFMALGIELAAMLNLPLANISALILANNILDKSVNLLLISFLNWKKPPKIIEEYEVKN